mmetsp:Transcript_38789/g.78222  ORF Transcript_38789/g.78222 Transcript_38789/m.78222 type:complete len:330 (+) Transcript_38789:197-1186(+)|eukprot:CAMPEP_0171613268 /NCGR_PEP_ID=MMETSP0990-20121206/11671_1 /TAXON_ID=483369 /ORGANISM="non described non described, Strain CCMP2098" /LENGTH=329 /DNA_ID=CAMNT_0012177091 /DNA_START=99 /DNA_END=1088 /DNA_ORIENTATION=+
MSSDGGAASVPYTNTTTEFDDILIDKGIITKEQALLAHGMDPDQVADILVKERLTELGYFDEPEVLDPTAKQVITAVGTASAEALDRLEEDEEFCDDSFLQEFRQKRLDELKANRVTDVFGSVAEITKADWVREVNEASQEAWVLVLLRADHVDGCELLRRHLVTIAAKFRAVKCLTIPARSAVENFPDNRLPALFAYKEGELKHQLITLAGLHGLRCREEDLEWWLACKDIIKTDLQDAPNPPVGSVSIIRGASVGMGADTSSSGPLSPGGGTAYSSSKSSSSTTQSGSAASARRFVGSNRRGCATSESSDEDEDVDVDEYTNGGRKW